MPDCPNIGRYYSGLAELIELSRRDDELNIRPAFQKIRGKVGLGNLMTGDGCARTEFPHTLSKMLT